MEVYYIDRKTGEKKKEIIAGDLYLQWIYGSLIGNSLLEIFIKRKVFSSVYGKVQDLPISSRKIKNFITKLDIDMSEAEVEDTSKYNTFNDFFIRKLKPSIRPINREKSILISPADGRVFAYDHINTKGVLQIKDHKYSLEELFQDKELANKYEQGVCIVVRLNPSDYHRFHFPYDGIPMESIKIKGNYYSVNPRALKKKARIYCQNKREITILKTKDMGEITIVEVGATCVGSIIQSYKSGRKVKKGDEKGYFKFGGSTVILFLEPNICKVDEDILINTKNGLETKVYMGERIASRK